MGAFPENVLYQIENTMMHEMEKKGDCIINFGKLQYNSYVIVPFYFSFKCSTTTLFTQKKTQFSFIE